MQRHNLTISLEEDFLLIGIHSSIEDFNLAFLINKHFGVHLKRKKQDLVVFTKNEKLYFPVFEYENKKSEDHLYLISNTCKIKTSKNTTPQGLFESQPDEQRHFLVPEFKKTDFLLKLMIENNPLPESAVLQKLKNIPYLSAYYTIKQTQIKNTNNLNFN